MKFIAIYSVIFKKLMNENDCRIIAENINKYLKKILYNDNEK